MAEAPPRPVGAVPDPAHIHDIAGLLAWLRRLHESRLPAISYRRLAGMVNKARAGNAPAVGMTTVYDLLSAKGTRSRVDGRLVEDVARVLGADDIVLHRLRQIVAAIEIADRPGTPVDASAAIPAADPHFTGRTEELQHIATGLVACHRDGRPPVAVIDGPPGIGKSALAIHTAHGLLRRSHPGVRRFHVDLHGFDPERPAPGVDSVLARLSTLAGMPAEQADDRSVPLAERVDRYRRRMARAPSVLVIDNAESIDSVRPLLPGVPGCTVIVTTRSRCVDPSVVAVTLRPLPGADALRLLRHAAGDRVDSDPATARHLAERLCFGHPYHLKMLIGLLRDPAKREWTLGDLGKLIEKQPADDPSRRLLSTVLESLPVRDRRVFCLLGLLAGHGFTAADTAVLADVSPSEARHRLARLHDRHLLSRPEPGVDRFRMHDITAAFARRTLDDTVPHSEQQTALHRLYNTETRRHRR
ncbi:hypothetical protein LX16_2999 [Stackebrandtia albiflava]|uniref:AAA+ ATPase domain-containing protein n=1 Tax=Stackebrandtia albiflava TaxID=406432 RepID=A0A562V2Y6_9ACTN|nr:AAA family ATPase [Stackebrandtia albiflava]TWJ12244.1 hypothetical protein LX16_2999 [Stackebrandtia albiflava]